MKIKHLIIVALIVAILTIGAVSASEDANNLTANDAQGDSIQEASEDDGVLEEPSDNYEKEIVVPQEVTWEYEEFDEYVFVGLPGDAKGNVSAYIDDDAAPFYNNEYNGHAAYIYFKDVPLTFSNHTLKLNYTGDSSYKGFQYTYPFNVTYNLNFNRESSLQWGEKMIILFTNPKDIDGDLALAMNGKSYRFVVEESLEYDSRVYRCTVPEYNLGINNFTITISNDPKYPNKSFNGSVAVYSSISIVYPGSRLNQPMGYSYDGKIILAMPDDAKGTLNVTVDGEQFADATLSDGKFIVSLASLSMGKHVISANYTGSDYYVQPIEDKELLVVPNVIVPKFVYSQCENYTVTVILDENASDTLKIIDIDKSEEIFSGNVKGTNTFNISSDVFSIEVKYGNYSDCFTIYKSDVNPVWTINITYPSTVLKGENFYINGNYPPFVELWYVIDVDGKKYESYYPEIEISDLALGQHNFTIEVSDDDRYFITQNASGSFNIVPVIFDVDENVVHSVYGALIHIRTAEGVTGNVRLLIDGKDYTVEFIEDEYSYIDISDLACGQHDYEITYSGNYPQQSQKGRINVTYDFDIHMDNEFSYGEYINIWPVLPMGATGTITLKIGNKTYTSSITYDDEVSKVNFDLPVLDEGEYVVEFTYNGDNRLNYPQTINKTFNVIGYQITCPENDLYWNNDEYVTLILPENATGNLTVTVDGNPFANVKLENGIAKVPLKNLPIGLHDIVAQYSDDDYSVDDLKINGIFVNIWVRWSDSVLLNKEGWISLVLPDDAKGNFTITFGEDNTTAVNATPDQMKNYTFAVKVLGSSYFTLKYTGDDYPITFLDYDVEPVKLCEYDFVVEPYRIVTPETGGDEIILDLPEDAKGNLTVYNYIGDEDIYERIAGVAVNGSQAKISLVGLEIDTVYFKLVYEDEKYGTFEEFFEYSPKKPEANITITSSVKVYDAVINFELPSDANGSLIIKFNDKFYVKDLVGGKASLTVDGLAIGDYTVEVTYSGGDNYSKSYANATVTVPKPVPAKIVANDMSAIYSAGAKYSVTVYVEGGELAKNVNVVIKVNGKKVATVKTDSNGVATYKIVQVPGSYKITAEALGAIVTKKLVVKHVLKLKKVNVKRSAKKLTIKATLVKVNGKYLKGKKITLKFKGKKYTAKTNKKGVAKFTIKSKVLKKLKKGKKVTYKAAYLKDTVKYTVKVK